MGKLIERPWGGIRPFYEIGHNCVHHQLPDDYKKAEQLRFEDPRGELEWYFSCMTLDIRTAFLESSASEFARTKSLGLKAIRALSDEELNRDINGANSIAILVKHLHGNMKSRWTNIFTEDGEKPDRDRDGEFLGAPLLKSAIENLYLEGWAYLEKALADSKASDFGKTVLIRKEPLSLLQAIHRQMSHYAYHVGQIVILAKQFKGQDWESLSIPKGKSKEHQLGTYTKP